MLFTWLCNVRHSFLSVSHLVFDFVHKFCCVTAHDENFGTCPFLGVSTIKLARSIMNYLSVPYGLRSSVEKRFFMVTANLLHRIPRSFLRFPRSIVRRSPTFPLLRRPRSTITWWWRSIKFPWSIVYRNRFLRISTSMPSPPRVWSWRRHDRKHPRTKIHHKSWVLETCLIVGLLPLMIILITTSLSSNTYNKASWRADWTFERTESMSFITSIFLWDLWRLWSSKSSCPDRSETRETFPRTETIRSNNSRAGNIQSQSKVQRDDFRFCWTVRNSSLFLAHPTYWNKSTKTQNVPPEVDFESSRSPAKSESWTIPICIVWQYYHMTILFVFTCMMNIWNQSIQALVTSLGPFL